ncbi:MAG TPA: hypothetical protein VFR41_14900 [Acidimicrobiia bacterium]|nr:hypothetical protein [Acidimicrobiia bacterium]
MLLTAITVFNFGCFDRVAFGFRAARATHADCAARSSNGPFVNDASGAPVAVQGEAFIVVRCSPASAFDFANGVATFSRNRISVSGTNHVTEVVKLGDNEGVLSWVIGLDTTRPFNIVNVDRRAPITFVVVY